MSQKKNSIGITGGIGSGKSYVCHLLEQRGIPVFYTDAEAKLEMLENKQIQAKLTTLLGAPVLLKDGKLNTPLLSQYISQGDDNAQRVNGIVHPAVRQRMRRWLKSRRESIVAVECALLFESGYSNDVDYTVVVVAPVEVKIARVMKRDGHSREHVLKMMALQMSDEEKMSLGDDVIVNDNVKPLEPQIERILKRMREN